MTDYKAMLRGRAAAQVSAAVSAGDLRGVKASLAVLTVLFLNLQALQYQAGVGATKTEAV